MTTPQTAKQMVAALKASLRLITKAVPQRGEKAMEAKTKASGGNVFTNEERQMLANLRKLRAEEAKPLDVPPALLDHGLVTVRQAAKLMGMTPTEFMEAAGHGKRYVNSEERVPLLKKSRRTSISELHRLFKRMRLDRLERLAHDVVDLVKTEGVSHWHNNVFSFVDGWDDVFGGPGLEQMAAELGIGKAAMLRVIDDDSTDSVWVTRHHMRRGFYATVEEWSAFKRKLAARGTMTVAGVVLTAEAMKAASAKVAA